MLTEPGNRFSITRAAPGTSGRTKSIFLPVELFQAHFIEWKLVSAKV